MHKRADHDACRPPAGKWGDNTNTHRKIPECHSARRSPPGRTPTRCEWAHRVVHSQDAETVENPQAAPTARLTTHQNGHR